MARAGELEEAVGAWLAQPGPAVPDENQSDAAGDVAVALHVAEVRGRVGGYAAKAML